MKKSTIIVFLLLIAVMLGVTAVVSADSKENHYASVKVALETLYGALDRGDKSAAEKALMNVSTAVYDGMRYLASVNEYDPRAMEIINNASLAMNKDNFDYYFDFFCFYLND